MKRRHVVAVVVAVMLCAEAVSAGAQLRFDFAIALPVFQGINLGDFGISGGTTASQYLFLLPTIEASYQIGEGPVRFGVGAKAVTFILESLAWPTSFVEIDLNQMVIRGELGGGLFVSFGRVNEVPHGSWTWVVPQIDVGFRLTNWFRPSIGIIALAPFDNMNNFGFLLYLNARFIILGAP
jgi:hypothetical protein